MKLVPLARSWTLALALGLLASPAVSAHRRVRHTTGGLRSGAAAVHWLRHEHGKRLITGETNHQLASMSRDPHSFLAGGSELMDYDVEHHWASSAIPEGPTVLRVGNTSVRNMGTVRDGFGESVYDWLSFDQAGQGSAMADLRQALVSLVLLGHELAYEDADISGVLLEAMRTYRDGIARMSGHPHTKDWAMTAERGNPFTRRMLNTASHRRRQDLLDRWTVEGHHGRRFKLEGEFAPIEPRQAQVFWDALKAMKTDARPDSYWLVKDAVVRSDDGKHRGQHHKVYLLIEGPTSSLVDDFILEAYQPCQEPRHVQWAAWQIRRSPEPFFGVITVDGTDMVLREVQTELMPLVEERVESLDDYYDVGRTAGILLARAHAVTASDQAALGHFARDWAANPQPIEAGLGHFAFAYAAQVTADHAALAASWTPGHTLVAKKRVRTRAKVTETTTTTTTPAVVGPVNYVKPGKSSKPVKVELPGTPLPPPPVHDAQKMAPVPVGPPPVTPIAPPSLEAPAAAASTAPATPATPPPSVPQPLAPPDEAGR